MNNDFLSQEEIDALLNKNKGGDREEADEMGNPLDMEVYQPFGNWDGEINISGNGAISKIEDGLTVELGRVILYRPDNPDNLLPLNNGNYLLKEGTGLITSNDDENFGSINQYFLEESNANLSKSMVEMITTQRAYSINAKALQTTDEIMTMINDIKR